MRLRVHSPCPSPLARHGSSSHDDSSSSSDDTSSSSSDDDDDIPMPKMAPVPDLGANPVAFENPYAMDLMGVRY